MRGSVGAIVLVFLGLGIARAEEPAAPGKENPTGIERSTDPDHVYPGFGQADDEEPRNPRVRLETYFLCGITDSKFRYGKPRMSSRFNPHNELGVSRFTPGFLGQLTIKLHRFIGLGAQYFTFGSSGGEDNLPRIIRVGRIPSEVPQGTRARANFRLEQANLSLRFIAADDAELRAEFHLGVTWVSYHFGVFPRGLSPLLVNNGRLPGGGLYVKTTNSVEAWLAPSLGTFFVWNFHPNVGLYIDTTSAYVSFYQTFGSLASINRAGLRFRLFSGLEIVVGIFIASGQIYDIKDRLQISELGTSHVYKQAFWLTGGPELGVSFTY